MKIAGIIYMEFDDWVQVLVAVRKTCQDFEENSH